MEVGEGTTDRCSTWQAEVSAEDSWEVVHISVPPHEVITVPNPIYGATTSRRRKDMVEETGTAREQGNQWRLGWQPFLQGTELS